MARRGIERRLPALEHTIDIRAPFVAFGLTSRDAVEISGQLEKVLYRRLSPTLRTSTDDRSVGRALGRGPSAEAAPAADPTRAPRRARRSRSWSRVSTAWGIERGRFCACSPRGGTRYGRYRWTVGMRRPRRITASSKAMTPRGTCLRWGGFDWIDCSTRVLRYFPARGDVHRPATRLLLERRGRGVGECGPDAGSASGSRSRCFVGFDQRRCAALSSQVGDLEPYWSTGKREFDCRQTALPTFST